MIKSSESREEREYQWDGGFRNESILFCLGRPIIPFNFYMYFFHDSIKVPLINMVL
jgi:hypothetical protein